MNNRPALFCCGYGRNGTSAFSVEEVRPGVYRRTLNKKGKPVKEPPFEIINSDVRPCEEMSENVKKSHYSLWDLEWAEVGTLDELFVPWQAKLEDGRTVTHIARRNVERFSSSGDWQLCIGVVVDGICGVDAVIRLKHTKDKRFVVKGLPPSKPEAVDLLQKNPKPRK